MSSWYLLLGLNHFHKAGSLNVDCVGKIRWYFLADCPITDWWPWLCRLKTVCDTVGFCRLHFSFCRHIYNFQLMISMFSPVFYFYWVSTTSILRYVSLFISVCACCTLFMSCHPSHIATWNIYTLHRTKQWSRIKPNCYGSRQWRRNRGISFICLFITTPSSHSD